MPKELLFSITKKDLDIEPFKGSGKGGQHRNKTESCVRIRHKASGVEVVGTEHREQGRNKKLAFERLISHPKFKLWIAEQIQFLEDIRIEYGPFYD